MTQIFVIVFITILLILVINSSAGKKWITPKDVFPKKWRNILNQYVLFYKNLSTKEKILFEFKVQEFLANCDIVPVETTITDEDRVLVAASAVIPIFAFPNWRYTNVDEVLIYPDSFSLGFEKNGENRNILGMVGTGYMERKMILSQKALRLGFANESDKRNTAIHEFIHLIDKADGVVDGIPKVLLQRQYVIPWLDMMEKEAQRIAQGKSDINHYALTNRQEFFAVLGEYFFERPTLFKKNHPELFILMEEIFK